MKQVSYDVNITKKENNNREGFGPFSISLCLFFVKFLLGSDAVQ